MPDFTVTIIGGDQVPWIDAKSENPERASRLKNDPEHLRSYRKFQGGDTMTVKAIVSGVVGPLDGALGGRLFTAAWVEWSGIAPPLIVQASGQSSVVTADLAFTNAGHFILRLARAGSGSFFVPFDVENPEGP